MQRTKVPKKNNVIKNKDIFEIINKLLDKCIVFKNIIIPKSQITKVNNIKDIKKLKTFV